MKKSFIKVLTFVLTITLCLTACSKPQSAQQQSNSTDTIIAPTHDAPDLNSDQTEPLATENDAPIESPSTQHITQELCENVVIDADVVIPAKTEYSTYTLENVNCDPDHLFGIFCPEGYGSYTANERTTRRYFESSGKKLVVRETSIGYSAYNIDLGYTPMQDVETLMYYHTQSRPDAEPHDLSFMTVAEMENYCKNLLIQLGISYEPKLYRCVTMTGQEILDFQNELFGENGIYTELGGYTPTTLTSAEDTCYLEYSFTYDDIPLLGLDEPGISSAVDMMPTSAVTATIMITSDGLQSCDVFFPCTVSASQPQRILDVQEAIAVLKNKFEIEILFGESIITDIWMEYIPVKQGDSYVLTPYWCFVSVDASVGESYGAAERINAITGEDLTYGG